MKTHKTFHYRVYPTAAQERRLIAWESALRWLWNLALEQWKMGMARPRGERVYPSAFSQGRELTELRRELPWLNDVPRHACEALLARLDRAWRDCFDRRAREPNWKRKGADAPSIVELHAQDWSPGEHLHFPKLGPLRIVQHRPLEGKRRSCTLTREGDQWFASIVCEVEISPMPRTGPVVAIDRGITNFLADSEGRLVRNPRHLDHTLARLARAQRVVSRRKKGSKNREKAKLRVMRLHRKVRRQRDHFLHVESCRIAKSHGVVVLEDLNVRGMVRGNLGRQIGSAGWSRFAEMLRYKLAWSGGSLVEVPAQYSSQSCSACGAVDSASRSGESFRCTSCGHGDHADLNAAKVLLSRAPVSRGCLPVEGTLPESVRRSRKARRESRGDYYFLAHDSPAERSPCFPTS